MGAAVALVLATTCAATTLAAQRAPERVMGAPFDDASRAFLDVMIPHHEVAVVMARRAVAMTRSDSVRALARQLISRQQREIAMMREVRYALFGSDSSRGELARATARLLTQVRPIRDSAAVWPGDSLPVRWDSLPRRADTVVAPLPRGAERVRISRDTVPMPRRGDTAWMHRPIPREPPPAAPPPYSDLVRNPGLGLDRLFLEHMIAHYRDAVDIAVLAGRSDADARVKQLALTIGRSQAADIVEMRRVLATLPAPP